MYIRHFFNNKLLHINTVLLVLRCFEMGLYMVFLLSKYWLQYKNGRLHLFKFKFEMCMYTLFLLSKDWFKFTKNGRLYLSLDVLRCECICCFFLSKDWLHYTEKNKMAVFTLHLCLWCFEMCMYMVFFLSKDWLQYLQKYWHCPGKWMFSTCLVALLRSLKQQTFSFKFKICIEYKGHLNITAIVLKKKLFTHFSFKTFR